MASFYRISVFTKLEAHKEGIIWPSFSDLDRPHLGESVVGYRGKAGSVTLKVIAVSHSEVGHFTADCTRVVEIELG